jgi:predicted kinase
MRTVTILRGISGAGKSTYTRNNHPNATVCSADPFFINFTVVRGQNVPKNDGVYSFNPAWLGRAHDWCKAQFHRALSEGQDDVVVDNTNTTLRELNYYVDTAVEFGYTLNVVRLTVDPAIAAARNQHGVPAEKVQQMQDRFQDFPGEVIIDTTPVTA